MYGLCLGNVHIQITTKHHLTKKRSPTITVPLLQTKFELPIPSKPSNIQIFAEISAYQFAASWNKIVIISAEFKLDYSAIGHFDSSY